VTATLSEPITVPGAYDIPADVYHADPVPGGSLSSSGARKILDSPARYKYEREHAIHSTAFDIGHAAHKLVLGVGPETVVIDAQDWRTKAAKEARDEAYAAGYVPLLLADWRRVEAMAAAIQEHPLARAIFSTPTGAHVEQTLIWRDGDTGVWRRAMLDWRRERIVVDFKTAVSASPASFAKSVANFGYHQQDAWYRDGVAALGLANDPAFLFVVQEKEPPYLVAVYDLDDEALRVGRERNRRALERYRDCVESGVWPGYSTDIETITLPRWAEE
jgi:hypothetical protein